jgi:predicted lipid-binding transport protein (Tim44 family)
MIGIMIAAETGGMIGTGRGVTTGAGTIAMIAAATIVRQRLPRPRRPPPTLRRPLRARTRPRRRASLRPSAPPAWRR